MSIERNRRALHGYLMEHDDSFLAADAVFTDMSSGQEWKGREEVAGMLHWFYHVAFDAEAEPVSLVIDEEHAAFEGIVVGRHIGEFAGIPATNKEFRAPLCVVYDLADGKITRGRVYFAVPALLAQLGVTPS